MQTNWKKRLLQMDPPRFIIISFLLALFTGTLLLKLPVSTQGDLSWLDSMFVAGSALTVTGLSTINVEEIFTTTGFVFLALLIQIGGLGVMSFAILIFVMIGRKIGLYHRMVLQQQLNVDSVGGIIRLARYVFAFSFVVEFCAFILLSFRFVPEYGLGEGLFASMFHSISAFNNAGFSIWFDNFTGYVGDIYVNLVITSLIIIGGLGFTVVLDLYNYREKRRLSLHTKLMIVATFAINIVGTIVFYLIEHNNPLTLGPMSFGNQWLSSYFQVITCKTAGFNTLDIASISSPTLLLMMILMFIGGGSGSTAGGIKLTTFIVIVASVGSFLRGKNDIVLFKRTVREGSIIKALSVTMLAIFAIVTSIMLLSVTETKASLLSISFETISAFGTVGLTMGLTYVLSTWGKLIIIFMMFLGKVGPLTLAFSLAHRKEPKIKYPKEDILIS